MYPRRTQEGRDLLWEINPTTLGIAPGSQAIERRSKPDQAEEET